MHKLATTPITTDCFEMDDFVSLFEMEKDPAKEEVKFMWEYIISNLEFLRQLYLETKDKTYWKELIRLLPSSWLQTRTVTMNYENLFSIYYQRKSHKLTEWHTFCDWIKDLPYAKVLFDIEEAPEKCSHKWTIHHLGGRRPFRECELCGEKEFSIWVSKIEYKIGIDK